MRLEVFLLSFRAFGFPALSALVAAKCGPSSTGFVIEAANVLLHRLLDNDIAANATPSYYEDDGHSGIVLTTI